jgi:hypothetical protein
LGNTLVAEEAAVTALTAVAIIGVGFKGCNHQSPLDISSTTSSNLVFSALPMTL